MTATAVALAGGLACGGEQQDAPDAVRDSFTTLTRMLAARDAAGVCDLMAPAVQRQVGSIGHAEPTTCERDAARFMKSIDKDPRSRQLDPRIARVTVDGDRATVLVDYSPTRSGAFLFLTTDGRWKLGGVFSSTANSPKELATPVPGLRFVSSRAVAGPARPGDPAVVSAGRSRCPQIESTGALGGGPCHMKADKGAARLRLKSLFGDSPFADCYLNFNLQVEASGRAFVRNVNVDYPGGRNSAACGDIESCRDDGGTGTELPWVGRVRLDGNGTPILDVHACFDSCAGRLEGGVRMLMTRDARGWTVRANDSPVGRSGLSVSGKWRLRAEATPAGAAFFGGASARQEPPGRTAPLVIASR